MSYYKKKSEPLPSIPCGAKPHGGGCHWILRHDTEDKVFGSPLRSLGECESTLQVNNLSNYHPEHNFNQYQTTSDD